ncbi:uncharacterized protein CDAR_170081 [Caerostris darwini]|uniref:Uncharacterized protein n=1 Tax=Caerostris darwini TaxID=1538125 RepID=A0AAV4RWJ7_9ARAC|nr:uncharacterized protein CDAR_170081 [Caerostris darwini]
MTTKKAVERLDSMKSLHELEFGDNTYVSVSTLVECVNETLDTPTPNTEIESNIPFKSNESKKVAENEPEKSDVVCDDPAIPVAFRSFLRRFSETNGVEEKEFDRRNNTSYIFRDFSSGMSNLRKRASTAATRERPFVSIFSFY